MGRRPVLEVRELWAGDPTAPACRGVDLALWPGSVTAVLGGPGAGKSQLLRCMGLDFAPLSGHILLHGVDITGLAPDRRRRLRTEAIELVHPPAPADEPDRTIPATRGGVVLAATRPTVPIAGMRQRIQIAKALTRRSDALLLDEPLIGLDEAVRTRILELVDRLRTNAHTAILVATRHEEVAVELADHVVVLEHGTVAGRGHPDDLLGGRRSA
ncbi:MAG TPA: ATP-binding cassette domain-containing protein [Acidimicrobiales bacterium]|nr:ATP-binding cassette domain-containing protein [Acidimicrobiales bacterium]